MSDKQTSTEKKVTIIHCWSAPRSRSTALLYSFESRNRDRNPTSTATIAIDEPLYREWLIKKGNTVSRPYTQELIQGIPPKFSNTIKNSAFTSEDEKYQWERELDSLNDRITKSIQQLLSLHSSSDRGCNTNDNIGVIFCKHMAKHAFLYNFDQEYSIDFVNDQKIKPTHKHVLLIRDPVAILSSWDVSSPVHGCNVSLDEVGIIPLLSIYSSIQSASSFSTSENIVSDNVTSNKTLVVLDSDKLALYPQQTLKQLCHDLDIPFTEAMLSWEKGPHKCDGPWASWWYQDVHNSSGWFEQNNTKSVTNDKNIVEDDPEQQNTPPIKKQKKSYRTMHPSLMNSLRASMPAYEFLYSETFHYKSRASLVHSPSDTTQIDTNIYEDERNKNILIYIGTPTNGGRFYPREYAKVSPFDSSVQGGDATWEGLRLYDGKILSLDAHLKRLFRSAKALGFDNVFSYESVVDAIFKTCAVNGMRDGVHIRLTLTRGEKCTSSMNPKFNIYGTTLIILPEWKAVMSQTTYDNISGISLITASTRRNSPSTCDSKIHHNNLINNILPKIQANNAGAADAIMLDLDGFVSETNATNIFMVSDGTLITPHADHCLPGITRDSILTLAKELNIPTEVRRVSLAEFHSADEVFTTGTMGGLTPVTKIDGRVIGCGKRGNITEMLQMEYKKLPDRPGWFTKIPDFV